jgi:hypothetical protein
VVQMLVKEFVDPGDLGHRLYTLHIADVSTPASSEPPRIPIFSRWTAARPLA